jgi:hypothetical protein
MSIQTFRNDKRNKIVKNVFVRTKTQNRQKGKAFEREIKVNESKRTKKHKSPEHSAWCMNSKIKKEHNMTQQRVESE